ncbi:uncharacterized protein YjbI with pentapeptide repeats [Saonia flava]|uniref:Uncharacterized protein YjbI with pentapeptide repeats n=1 Tax=Saonia flava TaxID=523696 RepID=A0A846QXR6_9FLAO|nr:pentapeptide repeat-containing protein [Saonia flava]NJB71740.1 uncharacterized protein YjbI with pentapeptide repeats [Saonia flava]
MNKPFIEDEHFKGENYTQNRLAKGEYEHCTFTNCNFSNGNLTNSSFLECEFIDCNLSNSNITASSFNEVLFKDCKLLGLRFDQCNDFLLSFTFEDCALNLASFYQLKLKKIWFKKCILEEVDFVEADLTEALFDDCNLKHAIFENTLLEKADFRTSHSFSIDPENNRIKKAKFSKENIVGLLETYDIMIN